MVNQEDIDFWSRKYGRPVTETEVEEIKFNLAAFAKLICDTFADFKKRGLVDEKGNFMETKT